MSKYIVFSKPGCPFCKEAIDILRDRDERLSVIQFRDGIHQQAILSEIKSAYDHLTVPIILFRDEDQIRFIGGCDDLINLVETGDIKMKILIEENCLLREEIMRLRRGL